MATFITDRPFQGVRQLKYRQLMETNPEWVAALQKEELEEYLAMLEHRFQSRCNDLATSMVEKKLAANPQIEGTAEHFDLIETSLATAREIALQELLDA